MIQFKPNARVSKTRPTNIMLRPDEKTFNRINLAATKARISRSEFIRQAVLFALDNLEDPPSEPSS